MSKRTGRAPNMAASLLALAACGDSHQAARLSHPEQDGGLLGDAAFLEPSDAGAADAASAQGTPAVDPPYNEGIGRSIDASVATARLSGDVVRPGFANRNVLYSWTTDAQIAELRANPTLLTRSESSTKGRANLSSVLTSLATAGQPLAQLLARTDFQKGRYGWSNAWATRRGWPGESYGNQLLRIVLKPEALIVALRRQTFSVFDLDNRPVDAATALAQPERIAAVYFINEGVGDGNACGSFTDCPAGAYREYFLNNERMIQEWSFGTQVIHDELERSITLVETLRDWLDAAGDQTAAECSFGTATVCTWIDTWSRGGSDPAAASTLFEHYRLALALTSEFYSPNKANMDALLNDLRASLFGPDPLIHRP